MREPKAWRIIPDKPGIWRRHSSTSHKMGPIYTDCKVIEHRGILFFNGIPVEKMHGWIEYVSVNP